MTREIAHVKALYPEPIYVGVAYGAKGNWEFLGEHTSIQVFDFYHAVGYLGDAAKAAFPKSEQEERSMWLDARCHELASRLLQGDSRLKNDNG